MSTLIVVDSSNGTWISGRQIGKGKSVPIENGACVRVDCVPQRSRAGATFVLVNSRERNVSYQLHVYGSGLFPAVLQW